MVTAAGMVTVSAAKVAVYPLTSTDKVVIPVNKATHVLRGAKSPKAVAAVTVNPLTLAIVASVTQEPKATETV